MVPMLPDVRTPMPSELTAPSIQRLVRKGVNRPLTDDERIELCECVLSHIEAILSERRIPRITQTSRRARRRVETKAV